MQQVCCAGHNCNWRGFNPRRLWLPWRLGLAWWRLLLRRFRLLLLLLLLPCGRLLSCGPLLLLHPAQQGGRQVCHCCRGGQRQAAAGAARGCRRRRWRLHQALQAGSQRSGAARCAGGWRQGAELTSALRSLA